MNIDNISHIIVKELSDYAIILVKVHENVSINM